METVRFWIYYVTHLLVNYTSLLMHAQLVGISELILTHCVGGGRASTPVGHWSVLFRHAKVGHNLLICCSVLQPRQATSAVCRARFSGEHQFLRYTITDRLDKLYVRSRFYRCGEVSKIKRFHLSWYDLKTLSPVSGPVIELCRSTTVANLRCRVSYRNKCLLPPLLYTCR